MNRYRNIDPEVTMVFRGYDLSEDGDLILHLTCEKPGPGNPGDFYISLTEEELNNVNSRKELSALVKEKIEVQFRPTISDQIKQKLDLLVGQEITV